MWAAIFSGVTENQDSTEKKELELINACEKTPEKGI